MWQWDFSNSDFPQLCDDGDVTTEGYIFTEDTNREVEPAFEVSIAADGHTGTIDVSNAPGTGAYWTTIACEFDDEITAEYIIQTVVDVFTLNKVVDGEAADDAAFEIEVTASYPDSSSGVPVHGTDPHTHTSSFGADGGTQVLYHPMVEIPAFWTVEETVDGNADGVKIEERNIVDENGDPFATVTNTFDEVEIPDPPKEDDPKPTPVPKQPHFTG